jgi:hypothetical protein
MIQVNGTGVFNIPSRKEVIFASKQGFVEKYYGISMLLDGFNSC